MNQEEGGGGGGGGGDPCKDVNYMEPDIDSIRALKDQVSSTH